MKARRFYAPAFFWLSVAWLCVVGVALFLQGYGQIKLETPVLVAALATTTTNVLGILAIAALYIFPRHGATASPSESPGLG